jgi:hypothetical protein
MEQAINILGETVNTVLTVFMPILGPQPPSATDKVAKDADLTIDLSDMADILRVKTRRIKELTLELTGIAARCQL